MTEIRSPFEPLVHAGDLALCLGFFDGLHRGHRRVIEKALSLSPTVGVLTFDSQIKERLGLRGSGRLLTSIYDRQNLLDEMGVSYLFPLTFDEELRQMPAGEFLTRLIANLKPRFLVAGSDFRFGRGGLGTVSTLHDAEQSFGYRTVAVDLLQEDGRKIAASAIAEAIEKGLIKKANDDLGRPYSVAGTVVHGLANGRRLGFPTANLEIGFPYVIPSVGVYATRLEADNVKYLSMTNIGTHPTLDRLEVPAIETHVLDGSPNLYGAEVRLEFLDFFRKERRYESPDALKAQLERDRATILDRYRS